MNRTQFSHRLFSADWLPPYLPFTLPVTTSSQLSTLCGLYRGFMVISHSQPSSPLWSLYDMDSIFSIFPSFSFFLPTLVALHSYLHPGPLSWASSSRCEFCKVCFLVTSKFLALVLRDGQGRKQPVWVFFAFQWTFKWILIMKDVFPVFRHLQVP